MIGVKKKNFVDVHKKKIFFLVVCFVCVCLFLIAKEEILHKGNVGFRLLKNQFCKMFSCIDYDALSEPDLILINLLMEDYERYQKEEDLFQEAKLNSFFSSEAFNRLNLFKKGWMAFEDKETGLIPYKLYWGPEYRLYIPEQSAADFYPFLLLSAYYTNYTDYATLKKWFYLDSLYKSDSGLPAVVDLNKDKISNSNTVINYDIDKQIFGASETVKDGYLPLIELFGQNHESYSKSVGLIKTIFSFCSYNTSYGCIPSLNTEVNGEILISLSRLYLVSRNETFLDLGEPILNFYLFEVISENNGHLCNFIKSDLSGCRNEEFNLGDHGNEIIPGVVEFFYALSESGHNVTVFEKPIQYMLDTVKEEGLKEDGFWVQKNGLANSTDTWGYIHNAYLLYDHITDIEYDFVEESLENLKSKNIEEFAHNPDSVADSIECAIYLESEFKKKGADYWISKNIFHLFAQQKKNGVFMGDYKDGNVARTLLLFSLYKTKGSYLSPWRSDLRLGAVEKNKKLYVYMSSIKDWNGTLILDLERSYTFFGVEYYPRINSFPEWWTVNQENQYLIRTDDEFITKTGKELIEQGIKIDLKRGVPLFIIIEKLK